MAPRPGATRQEPVLTPDEALKQRVKWATVEFRVGSVSLGNFANGVSAQERRLIFLTPAAALANGAQFQVALSGKAVTELYARFLHPLKRDADQYFRDKWFESRATSSSRKARPWAVSCKSMILAASTFAARIELHERRWHSCGHLRAPRVFAIMTGRRARSCRCTI
jgi:hypothetical protein